MVISASAPAGGRPLSPSARLLLLIRAQGESGADGAHAEAGGKGPQQHGGCKRLIGEKAGAAVQLNEGKARISPMAKPPARLMSRKRMSGAMLPNRDGRTMFPGA